MEGFQDSPEATQTYVTAFIANLKRQEAKNPRRLPTCYMRRELFVSPATPAFLISDARLELSVAALCLPQIMVLIPHHFVDGLSTLKCWHCRGPVILNGTKSVTLL